MSRSGSDRITVWAVDWPAALTTFLTELVATVERIEVAGPVEHLQSTFVAGFKHAPVVLVPRRVRLELGPSAPMARAS
jgi:hypothetical protein